MNYTEEDYKGFKINIIYDECSENPRKSWDSLGILAYYSKDSILGDKDHCHQDREGMLESIADLSWSQQEWYGENYNKIDVEQYLLNQIAKHSIFIDDEDRFCYVSKEDVKKEWKGKIISSKTKKIVLANLHGELKVQQQWGDGEVFGYDIEEINDSVWGFYGTEWDENGLLDYAHNAIDCHIKEEQEKALKAKALCKG